MPNWVYHERVAEADAHREELLRQAREARLVRMARQRPSRDRRLYRMLLAAFGARLIAWGERLNRRFGPSSPATAPAVDASTLRQEC